MDNMLLDRITARFRELPRWAWLAAVALGTMLALLNVVASLDKVPLH
jgi:hypothetical protein